MLDIKWRDKCVVTVLTTIHGNEVVTVERCNRHAVGGVEAVEKPLAVSEYMRGVNTADQLLSYYGYSHCTVKWWRPPSTPKTSL